MDGSREPQPSGTAADVARLRADIERRGHFEGVRRLLVATSGGPDSTALLVLVDEVLRERPLGVEELWVGHVHHGLRGEEADADLRFARRLADRLGRPFLHRRVDARRAARERGLSEEEAGRELRYEVWREWAEERAIDAVALGHHREDRRESILLAIARGTGVRGLGGMPAERPLPGDGRPVRVVRPLIDWEPQEIERSLRARGETWRVDRSNRVADRSRNRLRLEILPALESGVHPGVRRSLDRLGATCRTLARDLASLAERAVAEASPERTPTGLRIDAEALAAWPESIRREALARMLAELEPERPPPVAAAFRRFDDVLTGPVRARAELGDGIVVTRRGDRVDLDRPRPGPSSPAPDPAGLEVGAGDLEWGVWRIRADRAPWPGPSSDPWDEWIDAGRQPANLVVRAARAGDRFHPLGSPGSKPLREFLRERRIPAEARDARPLVVRGGEIVWVVGERIAHPCRLRASGAPAIRLRARPAGDPDS